MNTRTSQLTINAIMLALAIVLSFVENMIPPLPFLPPGAKIGLSNIIVMYCLFFIGYRSGVVVTVAKSVFIFLTRGMIAGLLSICGGLLSIFIIILLMKLFKKKISYVMLSISGAVAHNIGQLVFASFLMDTPALLGYLPFLMISGVFFGIITGCLLKAVMPALEYITPFRNKTN